MTGEWIIDLLNISISASFIILAILISRPFLGSLPKYARAALWGILGIRLIFPFNIESEISLLPNRETVPEGIMLERYPHIDSGVPVLNEIVNPGVSSSFSPSPMNSANPLQVIFPVLELVWITGVILMLLYLVCSYLGLRLKMGESLRRERGVYLSDYAESPFILGTIRPRIYLPSDITDREYECVLLHERAHIARLDHIWKPLAFALLSFYWFNPFMWVGYVLLCLDIELACDERVIKKLDRDKRAEYSETLLRFGAKKRGISACPLAFGEVGVKARIRSVLNYEKPTALIIGVTLIFLSLFAACFLTYPSAEEADIDEGIYYARDTVYTRDGTEPIPEDSVPLFVFAEGGSVLQESLDISLGTYVTLGRMNSIYLTSADYSRLVESDSVREHLRGENLGVWKITPYRHDTGVGADAIYVFNQKAGAVYLGFAVSTDNGDVITHLFLMRMNEPLPTYLYTANYVSDDGARITLSSESSSMSISFADNKNYTARGSYLISGSELTFTTSDSLGFTFRFLIDNGSLIYLGADNAEGYIELIAPNTQFRRVYNIYASLYDSVLYDIDGDGAFETVGVGVKYENGEVCLRFNVYNLGGEHITDTLAFFSCDAIRLDKKTAHGLVLVVERHSDTVEISRFVVRLVNGVIELTDIKSE